MAANYFQSIIWKDDRSCLFPSFIAKVIEKQKEKEFEQRSAKSSNKELLN